MAEILNTEENETLQDNEEYSSFDEPEEQANVEEEIYEEEQDEEDDLPEKYRGKSARDIIRMHQEAEKLLGRQSSEVGELRKVVDNFILAQTNNNAPAKEEEVDFFEDPEKAIASAIAKHPSIKQAEAMSASMRQQSALAKLKADHPDYTSIVQDEAFAAWVKQSPIRIQLYQQADSNFDYVAANELLTTWKERQSIVSSAEKAEKEAMKRSRKAASTGGGTGGEGRSRKIYRRSDIVNLMQNNPSRYLELADEITLAYSEGRVK